MNKAEILDLLPTPKPDKRQEILDRLCDVQEADLRAVQQEWAPQFDEQARVEP